MTQTNFEIILGRTKAAMLGIAALVFVISSVTIHDKMSLEKRPMSPIPNIIQKFLDRKLSNYTDVKNFSKQFDSYYSDIFPLRNSSIQLFNQTKLIVNNKSPQPTVIKGKNDYFYYNVDEHKDIYSSSRLFSDEELQLVIKIYESRKEFVESLGKKYVVVISATKEEVYPENVPDEWEKGNDYARSDQLYKALRDKGFAIYFSKNDLIKAKQQTQVFYQTDSHWNHYGAYLAYKSYMSKLLPEYYNAELDSLQFKEGEQYLGDFSWLMGTGYYYEPRNPSPIFTNSTKITEETLKHPVQLTIDGRVVQSEFNSFKTDKVDAPSALLFRSSYHNSLMQYYAHDFKSVDAYTLPIDFSRDIVNSSKADIVIQETSSASLYEQIYPFKN